MMIICNPGIKYKNRHLQSILASSKLRLFKLRKNNPIKQHSKEVILETEEATLQGFFTRKIDSNKLFILIHGWEGSANSTYIQLLANSLYTHGNSSIFRLNFRDHGDTHHLNKDIFHSCRLNEIVQAIKQIIQKFPHKNIYLCGYSLGGNFSLRVAEKLNIQEFKLTKVFAISPPINPKKSMLAIEKSGLYSRYFMRKWQKSLEKKQNIFPKSFKNSQHKKVKSLDKLTEMLIIQHTEYNTTDQYFKGYQITENIIDNIKTPTYIITSWDDPVIPFEDFKFLDNKHNIKLITTKYGGHCGFINSWKLNSWIEDYILKEIENE
jgi:predicted alpha/beta-fold hydrolase